MDSTGNSAGRQSDKSIPWLGHCSEPFKRDRETGKWNPIEIYYPNQENFCEATSNLISGMKDNCRFIIATEEKERYFIDILDVRFESTQSMIRVFPERLKKIAK